MFSPKISEGIVPVKSLFPTYKSMIDFIFPNSSGIEPVSSLYCNSRSSSLIHSPNVVGISPESWLLKLAQNVASLDRSPTLSEIVPERELFLKMTSSRSRLE